MAKVRVIGVGHPGDPFQVQVSLDERDIDLARADDGLVLDCATMDYEDDPQVRTVVLCVIACAET
jgi:hypothetical protein